MLHLRCYTAVLEDLTKILVNEWWYFSLTEGDKIVATPIPKKERIYLQPNIDGEVHL